MSIYFLSSVSLKENLSDSCKHIDEKFWKALVLCLVLCLALVL